MSSNTNCTVSNPPVPQSSPPDLIRPRPATFTAIPADPFLTRPRRGQKATAMSDSVTVEMSITDRTRRLILPTWAMHDDAIVRRALIAAMRPFGSLSEAYGVNPHAVAELMIDWVDTTNGDIPAKLFAILGAATCEHPSRAMFGRNTVRLETPTSGTTILLRGRDTTLSTPLRGVEVDFGPAGSTSRAAEIFASGDAPWESYYLLRVVSEGASTTPNFR